MLALPETDHSLWRDFYPKSMYQKLTDVVSVDVAIVGAGITGMTSAYLLKRTGLTVAVLDKDTIGGGTTGRTTGKVTSQHSLIYADIKKHRGEEPARAYAEANQAAVEKVAEIISTEKIDCDWRRADNYVFTTDKSQIDKFRQEAEVAASLGLPASFEAISPLPFEIQAAVKFQYQGMINSQKYLLSLAASIHGHGSYIFEHSNVTGLKDKAPAEVRTREGRVIAKDIIVATNVPTLPLLARSAYCLYEYPEESYIVAGRLPREVPGMYISPDKNNFSILPITVDGAPMILIGGKNHISGLRGSTARRYRQLADYAEQHFGVSEITHRWSDRDYLAYDYVPLVGRVYPWSQHMYAGTAYRKWGLSNGTAAAMILCDQITGQPNRWTATFAPNRKQSILSIPRVAVSHLKP